MRAGIKSFGVIGFGNMGGALVGGAVRSGLLSPPEVTVFDLDPSRMEMARKAGLATAGSLERAASSDALLLAVKPKDMAALLDSLRLVSPPGKQLIISIAAGVTIGTIEARLGEGSRVVRIMPNIAASVNEAASVFVANRSATAADIGFVDSLLRGVGAAFRIEDEAVLDVVTGISGSGPAYFFLLSKALEEVGRGFGLSPELARALVAQTCKGAGSMALQSGESFDRLIGAVASPGGTTEEALKVMDSKGFSQTVAEAVSAAIEKSRKMRTAQS